MGYVQPRIVQTFLGYSYCGASNDEMNPEELANEMAATRKAIAIYLKRLLAVEEKIDRFTTEKKQRWKDEQVRRRERSW
ncbi:MAG: hypothetical protein ACHQ1D_03630 [Nitrososphaerales archaeon]